MRKKQISSPLPPPPVMFIHELHLTWYPRSYWAIIKSSCGCTSYASSSSYNKAFWKLAYSVRVPITSVLQLQSLVLRVGRGKQEKDTGSWHKAFWRSWGLPRNQASSWCRLNSPFFLPVGQVPCFLVNYQFCQGDVNFQPKNKHWTSQLRITLALPSGSYGPLP